MTKLDWGAAGSRQYEAGLDRAVLYFPDYSGVAPWVGLISVDEEAANTTSEQYLDGVKYLDRISPGGYSAKAKAFAMPEELLDALGTHNINGLELYHQRPSVFSLSYRTGVGNDIIGAESAHKIHLVYSVTATLDGVSRQTLGPTVEPVTFGLTLTALPQSAQYLRPTAHIAVNTLEADAGRVEALEAILYGTDETDPYLPSLSEVFALFS